MPPQTHLLLLTDPKVSQLQLPLWVTGFARPTHTLTQTLKLNALTPRERKGKRAHADMHAMGVQTRRTQMAVLALMRSPKFVYRDGIFLHIEQEWPCSFGVFPLQFFKKQALLSWCETQRPLAVSEMHAGTHYFCRFRTSGLSGRERAFEMRL